MNLAIVVQRYGLDVSGGAELHARYVAELLASDHQITVLTTTANDYLRWSPRYPVGATTVEGIDVIRFPVERERNLESFADAARIAYAKGHSRADEEAYLESQGPFAPSLWQHLEESPDRYDAVIAFSYRYITTHRAAMAVAGRAVLVPTAERDPAVELELTRELLTSVAAIAYNTSEERAMLEQRADIAATPADIVGIGSRIPTSTDPERFRQRHSVVNPYCIYVGRIDRNKGCEEMFDDWRAFLAETASPHDLLLVGQPVLDIPRHPRIRHLGFLSDEDKFDALAGADALLVPSPFESLSMVTLEAMALGVPPVVNGQCEVLRGQVTRANAGLYYSSYDELFEILCLLFSSPRLRAILGRNGRRFYDEHYRDEVIAGKLNRLLAHAARNAASPRS